MTRTILDDWERANGVHGTSGKPRAKSQRHEDILHVAVKKLLTLIIAPPGIASSDRVVWYSLEIRGKRTTGEGARNKSRGCIKGVPDIDIYYMGRAYKIELKAQETVVTKNQRELHHNLLLAEIRVAICRSLQDVVETLNRWRIPHEPTDL
jgi:hypothetical protein